ncbi:hypothetical protein BC629DRAFT_1582278 [Irpex lacteus]|nr:hypothetical protein BC629DRAFT_1582278 [Irpex lacteus]
MDREVRQLVEMGATPAQARAALKQYKDVEQAAERFFDGAFADVVDDSDDVDMGSTSKSVRKAQVATPDPEEDDDEFDGMAEDSDGEVEEDDDENEYSIFFSKDRREEVIEVEEESETIMTQGQWMKGCPEGGEQSFLFGLYSELSEGACKCPHGCGSAKDAANTFVCMWGVNGFKSTRREECLFHCANLQGAILGSVLLCWRNTSSRRVLLWRGTRETCQGKRPLDDDDDAYPLPLTKGKKAKLGIGYAGDIREDSQAVQKAKDLKLSALLSSIRVYLPSLHREDGGKPSDYLPHPTTLAHLRRRFNYVSSQLLRNDSLVDMSDRSVLYFELFEWMEEVQLSVWSSGRERTIIYEGSSGPRELLEAIVIQAQAAIKGLEPTIAASTDVAEMTEEEKRMTLMTRAREAGNKVVSEENVKLLDHDRALVQTKGEAFVERLHASLPKIPGTSSGDVEDVKVSAKDSEEDVQKLIGRAPHYKFYYNAEARMLANSDIPKRSLAIAKELAVLTTNLPVAWSSSIFLRVDESRVDVIKALITGPEGTPYLFDIFLGPSYNQTPPSVKYMTTNGGKFRFNPNLYADGKVCLSLLGTWQGPGWVAGRSTLLQVLISIQSMILCDEPYLNEPGWAECAGTPQSKQYSANVRRMVVRTAMLGNLKNPPEPFADVIRTHFRLKARSIMKQLDDWLALDDGRAIQSDGMPTRPHQGTGSSQLFQNDCCWTITAAEW